MCGALGAGCAPKYRPTPGQVTAEPAVVEYGTVTAIPIPFHRQRVMVLNGTDAARIVRKVEKSDGVKVALASGLQVLPGGTGELVITLDARDREGAYTGEVTIHWEGDTPSLTIPLQATIESGVLMTVEGPNIEVVGPGDWDFGTIQRQAIEYFDFHIRNSGTEELTLNRIETHCGCVQAWADERRVAPGDTLPIHVRVTASVYPGRTPRKTVTITSNDPDRPVLTLLVYGTIEDAFTIEPALVDFKEVTPGTSPEIDVIVRANTEGAPRADTVTLEADGFIVERHPERETDGVVAAATVRIKADAPRGPFDRRLHVAFAPDSGLTDALVPVRGTIGAALTVAPTAVNFGLVREDEVYHRVLRIADVNDLAALQVDCQMNYLRAAVERDGAGARVRLTLAPLHGMGAVTGTVVLTDTATDRTRTVPVVMQFERASVGK